jgi:hypothetical protein
MMGPFRKTDQQSDPIYDTPFCRYIPLPGLLPSHRKLCNYAEPQPTYFHFPSSNFTVHDPVLNPAGDGLRHTSQGEKFTFQITEIVQKEKVTFFEKKF